MRLEALPLSTRLRDETREAHRLAEGTRFARAFARGSITAQTYAEMLARLYPVYAAMEAALLDARPADRTYPFRLPEVFRASAILEDLAFFGVAPEPVRGGSAAAYLERVACLARAKEPLLVAHAYVRYMGDVSGGLILGRIAARSLGWSPGAGLSFLSFNALDPARFRDDFRARLDTFSTDAREQAALVAEAARAFELNRRLAEETWDALPSD